MDANNRNWLATRAPRCFSARFSLAMGLALTAAGALTFETALAAHAARKKVPLPRPRPAIHAAKETAKPAVRKVELPPKRPAADGKNGGISAFAQANVGLRGALFASRATFKPLVRPTSGPFAIATTTATSAADIALVKQVIEDARKGKDADADGAQKQITDPVARKLAEWAILRSDNTKPSFQRYAAFVNANPAWPHTPLFTRRAENALAQIVDLLFFNVQTRECDLESLFQRFYIEAFIYIRFDKSVG